MIESIFKSYLPSKKWLEEDFPKAREEFFYGLPWTTVAAISYEEFTGGGSGKTVDEKMAIIADEMMYFDARHEFKNEQCQNTVKLCEQLLSQVKEEYRLVFTLLFMTDVVTHDEVARKLGWSRPAVTRIVKREIERISSIK